MRPPAMTPRQAIAAAPLLIAAAVARATIRGMATPAQLREQAERLRRQAEQDEEAAKAEMFAGDDPGARHVRDTMASTAATLRHQADDLERQAGALENGGEDGGEGGEAGDEPPADNPAEEIGEAAEAVEEAAAEIAEAIAEAGDPDTARAVELTVLEHLEAATAQLRAAQEVTEAAAEATEVATPPDTPAGDHAEEAVEEAEAAEEAVEEAEDAVRETARDAVHPTDEHPYYRQRSIFRRRSRA